MIVFPLPGESSPGYFLAKNCGYQPKWHGQKRTSMARKRAGSGSDGLSVGAAEGDRIHEGDTDGTEENWLRAPDGLDGRELLKENLERIHE
jgi:hypothetical protein